MLFEYYIMFLYQSRGKPKFLALDKLNVIFFFNINLYIHGVVKVWMAVTALTLLRTVCIIQSCFICGLV